MGLIRLGKEAEGTPGLGRSGRESLVPGRCIRVDPVQVTGGAGKGQRTFNGSAWGMLPARAHQDVPHRSAATPASPDFNVSAPRRRVRHAAAEARTANTDRSPKFPCFTPRTWIGGLIPRRRAWGSLKADVRELAASEGGISRLQGAGVGN